MIRIPAALVGGVAIGVVATPGGMDSVPAWTLIGALATTVAASWALDKRMDGKIDRHEKQEERLLALELKSVNEKIDGLHEKLDHRPCAHTACRHGD
jgi:predicted PP-loop superfamily ATPase